MPEDGQSDRENRSNEEQSSSSQPDASTPDTSDAGSSDADGRWQRRLKTGARIGAGAAVVLGVGLVAVGLGGRAYVQRKLLPQVETAMEDALQRDVTLGDVRFVWPWKVTIGASEIEELATVRSIDVRANVWTLLWRRQLAIALRLNQPDVTLTQTEDGRWGGLALNLNDAGGGLPVSQIALEIADGQLALIPADGEAAQFDRWQGRLQVPLADGEATWTTQARSDGGRVDAQGTASFPTAGSAETRNPRVELDVETDDISATLLNLLPITSLFQAQSGTADINLQATWEANQPLAFEGEALADGVSFEIAPVPRSFEDFTGRIELVPGMATLHGVEGRFGQIPLTASGTVEWDEPIYFTDWTALIGARFNIAGSNSELSLAQLQDTFGLELPVPVAGVVEGSATLTGLVTNPLLQGSFSEVAPATVSQLEIGTYSGDFALRGGQVSLTNLTGRLTNGDAQLRGSGRVNLAQSPVRADFQFAVSDAEVNGIVEAYQFDPLPRSLGAIDAQGTAAITGSRPVITADWQAAGGDIEGTGTFDWRDDTATIPQADLTLGDGTAAFSAVLTPAAADGGRAFSARAIPQSVPLGFFVPDIAGRLNGDIQIDGTTRDFSLAGLDASGQVELPDGIDRLPGPITAQVAWDGTGLTVTDGLVLDTVAVEGRIPFDAANQQVGTLALNLSARALPLENVPQLPSAFPVSGLVNLDGQLSGRLEALSLTGQLGLVDLRAAGLDFAPLQGPLQWQPGDAGVDIDLQSAAGEGGDRLAIALDPNFSPQSFLLQQGETSASGQREGDRFDIQLAKFPLALLNGIVPGVWNGTIDSELAVNLADVTAVGSVATYAPSWQGIQADRLQGSFAYGAGRLSITEGELQLQASLYRANGSVLLPTGSQRQIRAGRSQEVAGDPLRLDVRVSTENGSVEGLLQAIRWREWSDMATGLPNPQFGPATELNVAALDVLPRSLFDRLEAYSAIVVQQTELLDRQVDPRVPALANLTGEFSGDLQVVGAINAPIVSFDMTGRNWALTNPENPAQRYALDRVSTRGQYRETVLNLETLEAQSGDRKGTLSGTFGNDETQAGTLQLTRFPVELVSYFFPEAPPVTGDLNATADISGTLQNPMASGEFDLENLAISGNELDSANGVFDYRQATLSLDGGLRSGSPNPVVVAGTLPLSLPFSTAVPPSDSIDLELTARNEQLALLNLFTDAIAWESGDGLLDIIIGGTLQNPTLDGGLTVSDGVVTLSALPDPLQQLDAEIDFDFNRIDVQSFSGTFGEGTIEAAGLLAVNPEGRLRANDTRLAVQLEDLQMELPDLYRGEVDGDVNVAGTVLAPELGGSIRLTNGTISIPNGSNGGDSGQWQPRFNQLELTLGDNVQVVRQPLFAFTTEGTLVLNGTPSQLRPEGTIRIARGNINLGVANLRIDRGRENTVVFDRQGGLDPLLNVAAFTEVTERLGGGTVSNDTFTSSDSDTPVNLAEQRTIQVIATIQGRASELTSSRGTNVVALSSRPARSPERILALLGGAALDGIGSGNLAELALSTVLFGAQNALGNAIGLDELRITPFTGESGSLEVGVEAAKDLGAGVSVSVQQSLNDPDVNPRVNTRFRVGRNVLIRTGTDFEGDDQASFEFSTDF